MIKSPKIELDKSYTTDGKVTLLSNEEDINIKLAKIIGPKFTKYREDWDKANRMELVTEFPLFLHLFYTYYIILSLF